MPFLARIGRYCVGLAVAGSGLMQVINADFVRLVSKPGWLPAPAVVAVMAGALLVVIGAALCCRYRQQEAAGGLVVLFAVTFLLKVPEILANPGAGFVWTNPAKILALAGGALLLAASGGHNQPARRSGSTQLTLPFAAGTLGVFLLICGGQHIVYAAFVDGLVPAWIPPGPRFWTLFTAVALLAGGAGVLVPALRRPAGLLAGGMIFLWVLLLHGPRSVTMRSAFELAGLFEALALAGVAWLVAAAGAPADPAK